MPAEHESTDFKSDRPGTPLWFFALIAIVVIAAVSIAFFYRKPIPPAGAGHRRQPRPQARP